MQSVICDSCNLKQSSFASLRTPYLQTVVNKLFRRKHCSSINVHQSLPSLKQEQFTILINTWRRNDCLLSAITQYLTCSHVAQIRVIWSDPLNDIPDNLKDLQTKLYMNGNETYNRLVFDEYKDDKLTNRFKYNDEWMTDAIFQVDDDIKYSCYLLSQAFKLWNLFPQHMIGFAPRQMHNMYKEKSKPTSHDKHPQFYHYDNAYLECKYSLLFVTIGGFLHKKYYKMYNKNDINGVKDGWKQIRDYVDGNVTAEDISMSLFYSYITKYPPLAVTVPKSEVNLNDCRDNRSVVMHTNSERKRTNMFMEILSVLGYYGDNTSFDLLSSNIWLDVVASDGLNHKINDSFLQL